MGFTYLTAEQRKTTPSQYRRLHLRQNPDYPLISEETALVFQKPFSVRPERKHRFALVQAPSPASLPGEQLFKKQVAYATAQAERVFVWTSAGLLEASNGVWAFDDTPKPVWYASKAHPKAALRRPLAQEIARQLVTKYGLVAGDEIALHLAQEYGRYLLEHLTAFGLGVTLPTERLNFGQKLTYYTPK